MLFIGFYYVNNDCVQIPLPRKGTETNQSYPSISVSSSFKFHYPARGRKLLLFADLRVNYTRFKFHYPARGRKHHQLALQMHHVQIPLPRKGTETFSFGGV